MVDSIGQGTAGITGLGPSSNDATGSSALGKDEFVRLLMTQMQNQDPTSPQESEAFVAQLAQFAQVELAQAQSARLEAILVAQAASNQLAAAQLVGKDVTIVSDDVIMENKKASTSEIKLSGAASSVTVRITNADGDEVAKIDLGQQSAGSLSFTWDGQTADGLAKDGEYTISVIASNIDGDAVDATVLTRGRVDGVSYVGGVPALIVNGKEIPLAEVVGVHDPSSSSNASEVVGTNAGIDGGEDASEENDVDLASQRLIADLMAGLNPSKTDGAVRPSGGDSVTRGAQINNDIQSATHELWMNLQARNRILGNDS